IAGQPIAHWGQSMSALRSLTFTTMPKIGANPTLDRRTNIIARLEEQKLLLKDPRYTRTVRTWVKKDVNSCRCTSSSAFCLGVGWTRTAPTSFLFDQDRNRLSLRRARMQSPFLRSTSCP